MKTFFLALWGGFVLLMGPLSLGLIYREPREPGSYLLLAGVAFFALCTLRLIQEGYRPWGLLGERKSGFWLALLLLPLTLLPLHSAYLTWQQGVYVAGETHGHRRLLGQLLGWLLERLQDWFGYWGPIAAMVITALVMSLFLLHVMSLYRR